MVPGGLTIFGGCLRIGQTTSNSPSNSVESDTCVKNYFTKVKKNLNPSFIFIWNIKNNAIVAIRPASLAQKSEQ